MIGAKRSYQIGFSTSACCKTEACSTWNSLINQRTRWFKGFVTNEAAMLTDWQPWKRYPLLCVFRMIQDTIRTTTLHLVLLILSLMTKAQTVPGLPLPLISLSLGLNWIFMFYHGFDSSWDEKRRFYIQFCLWQIGCSTGGISLLPSTVTSVEVGVDLAFKEKSNKP